MNPKPDALPLGDPGPETRKLAEEAATAIRFADLPRLNRLIAELEAKHELGTDAADAESEPA